MEAPVETAVETRGGLQVEIGTDRAGRPVVSATVVLERSPGPDERLRDLVTHAVVALDLLARTSTTPTGTRVVVDVPGGPVEAAVSGPFGRVPVSFTVEGADAGAVLQSLVERSGGPLVRLEVTGSPGPASTRRVRVRLGRLWDVLDAHVGPARRLRRTDVRRHVADLVDAGAVVVEDDGRAGSSAAGSGRDLTGVADAVVRVAAGVLVPVPTLVAPAPGEEPYRVAERRPGDTEVTATVTGAAAPAPMEVVERPLGDLLADAGAEPGTYLSLVSGSGGRLTGLLPARRVTGGRAAPGPRLVMRSPDHLDRVEPVVLAAGGDLTPVARPGLVRPSSHLSVADVATVALFAPDEGQAPGPLVGAEGPAFWPDRFDPRTSWFVPQLAVVVPGPAEPAATAAFRFDVTPVGHALGGGEGLEAEITVTLATSVPDDVRAAWDAAGRPHLVPVPTDALTVQLAVPFRDEHGAQQVQQHFADSMVKSADFGADGGTLVAVFRLSDDWARMAYGALSTPGFQPEPAQVVVSYLYGGWRRGAGWFPLAQPEKVATVLKPPGPRPPRPPVLLRGGVALAERPPRALTEVAEAGLAPTRVGELGRAGLTVLPRLHADPALVASLWRDRFEQVRLTAASSVPVLVPCADHGSLYRRVVAGEEPSAIGCQDVLRLGQAPFRTYEPIEVAAAHGHATVLRSLTRPGHFLLVPDRYRVGRFGPDAGERAYRPRLLLTSVLDSDTADLRAVLAATLEADVAPSVRSAVVDELRTRSPEVVLELGWAAGLVPAVDLAVPGHGDVQCVTAPTGFTVVLTLDVPDFLVVRTLLETAGLTGSATVTLPDGLAVTSEVGLGLADVTGPYDGGPVALGRAGNAVELTNRIGSRVGVTSLRARGGTEVAVGQVLAPGGAATVTAAPPAEGEYDVVTVVESTRDTLEEVRVYVEDLEVEPVLVLAGSLGDAVALEVATTFAGHADASPVVLTADHRQEARRYTLPLTSYVDDPVLELVGTAVGPDGTRTSGEPVRWSLRSQGVVIPVSVPTTTHS